LCISLHIYGLFLQIAGIIISFYLCANVKPDEDDEEEDEEGQEAEV
jgi:hypothetical protein